MADWPELEEGEMRVVVSLPGGKCSRCQGPVITEDGVCPFCGRVLGEAAHQAR